MSEHAKQNAQAWWESIVEMVEAVNKPFDDQSDPDDRALEEIHNSALSVEVRDGWRTPGQLSDINAPEEYAILLSTGGPALRIYGHLNRYSEPDEDPILQWQDWGTPWTDYWPPNSDGVSYKDTLRQFAMQFYYGE